MREKTHCSSTPRPPHLCGCREAEHCERLPQAMVLLRAVGEGNGGALGEVPVLVQLQQCQLLV